MLDAWIDFNRDGRWQNEQEQVFASRELNIGRQTLFFDVPRTAVPGQTFARFRVSSQGSLLPTGGALDGEVEDYEVTIQLPDLSSGNFEIREVLPWNSSIANEIVDFDFDDDYDIVIAGGNQVALLVNDGRGQLSSRALATISQIQTVKVVDWDGDRDWDVYVWHGNAVSWLENVGDMQFSLRPIHEFDTELRHSTIADIDHDQDYEFWFLTVVM